MKKIFTFLVLFFITLSVSAQESAPEANTDGTLTVKFSTNTTAKYSLAIYITNSSGTLVNTMLYRTSNGHDSAMDMTTFWTKIGSSWSTSSSKLLTNADLDATSGATASSAYSNKILYWGKNSSVASLPDGTYTVNFEMANYEPVNRRYTSGTFVKGTTVSTSTLTTIVGFTAPVITWTPNNTAIDEVKANQYSVYPNPTRSTVYVSGFDIKGIDVITLNGKFIFSTNNQRMDLSALPKGVYLAKLTTDAGVFFKKIEKI